jgi:2,4-dienoyl-CoA reductase-like NADH-dependent reductase (Old Yellow Enzyme family)
MGSSRLDPLLQPFSIKGLTLRNRVVSTSHEPAYGEDGMPKDRYRLYHAEKAKGGVGLTMIGGSATVSVDSPPVFGNLELYRDEIVPWFQRLADDVHAEGAAVMCQITHLGRRVSSYAGEWLPAVAPTALREPAHRAFPKQAEAWDLDRIADDFVCGALRCREGGLDGIEIKSSGHLLGSFMSPLTNQRDDELGASLENRLAFPRRVIRAVRDAVGPGFIVGIRMLMDEMEPGGIAPDDALTALRAHITDGIDFVSVEASSYYSDAALARAIPGMGTPSAPYLELAGRVKRAAGIPVMHATRIQDVATARHAVREGLVDLVGMTRAQLADPHLVNKIIAGQEDRIRPCVGANYCLDGIYASGSARCVHNPATGREQTLAHEITTRTSAPKRVVVVGGGPGGLEAARVLGARGHQVVLLEAGTRLGGQILMTGVSPHRRDLIGIVDWRVSEAKHHGADIRTGVFADAGTVLAESPDVVIVATGGVPDKDFLQSGAALTADVFDVMDGSFRGEGSVLVYDDHGDYPALDAMELLASRGCQVEYVTPERMVAPEMGSSNSPAYLKTMAEHDVRITLPYYLRRVSRTNNRRLEATLWSEYADREVGRVVDHVVVDHGTTPVADLYFELLPHSKNRGEVDYGRLLSGQPQDVARDADGDFALYRIGDAVASRNIHAAILDALRLCLTI